MEVQDKSELEIKELMASAAMFSFVIESPIRLYFTTNGLQPWMKFYQLKEKKEM